MSGEGLEEWVVLGGIGDPVTGGEWGVGGSTSVGGSWGAVDGPWDAGQFDPDWARWASPSWGVGVWDGDDWLGTRGFAGGGFWGAEDGRAGSVLAHQHTVAHSVYCTCDLMLAQACV
jgi:hypothetical protein